MTEETLELIKNAEGKLSTLWSRMDKDAEIARLNEYTLTDSNGRSIRNVVSVTMNEPAVFLNAMVSMIQESIWQTKVTGGITPKQTVKVEKFINESLRLADRRLLNMGEPRLFPFLSNHICLRGWVGARLITQIDKGKYIPAIMPMDMRYFVYERGAEGLLWGAYKTQRSATLIEEEYGITPEDDIVEVTDFWDSEKEEVYIGEELVKSDKHKLGCVPFVIQASPSGFMLRDQGYMEYEGESIFALNRNMYEEYNRLISIDQTLAMKAVMPPYQKVLKDENSNDLSLEYPDAIGSVSVVKEGEEYQLIQRPDINNASRIAHQNISGGLQRGGVNDIDLGNTTFPTSAVWISEQTDIRNKLLAPRLTALGMFYEQLSRLLITEFVAGGKKREVDIGRFGKKLKYTPSDLGDQDDYDIECKLMSHTKKQEISNITVATQARGIVSRDTIIRDILSFEDPEGEIAKLESEAAEEIEPALKFFRQACSLCDEADNAQDKEVADQKRLESMLLTERAILLIKMGRQQAQAQTQGPTTPTRPQTPNTVPLNPQKNTPKKGADNGRNFNMELGGRPPKTGTGGVAT